MDTKFSKETARGINTEPSAQTPNAQRDRTSGRKLDEAPPKELQFDLSYIPLIASCHDLYDC